MRHQSLSWDLLLTDYNGHLQPLGFLAVWIFAQYPGSYLPAAATVLLVQLVTSLAVLVMLRELTGRRRGLLVGLALYLFCPLVIPAVAWWASFAITVPVQLGMALAGYCHLRLLATGRRRWLVPTLGGLALGLAFTEKAVLVPAFLVALTFLRRRERTGRVFADLRRFWWAWSSYAVLVIGYLALYRSLVELGDGRIRSAQAFIRLFADQVFATFMVGSLGGPWHSSGGADSGWPGVPVVVLVLLLQVVAVLAVLAWWWQGPWSLVPWTVLGGWLLLDVTITALGRGLWSDLIANDPRYLVDAILVMAAVAAVQASPRVAARTTTDAWLRRHAQPVTVGVVALIFNSSLVTVAAMAEPNHRDRVESFVSNVSTALGDDPSLNLYDGSVPGFVMIPLFPDDERRISNVLAAYDVRPRFDQPSEELRVLDEAGRPQQIRLAFAQEADLGRGSGSCPGRLRSAESRILELPDDIGPGRWVLRLEYEAAADGQARVVTRGDSSFESLLGLPSGRHVIDLVVPGPVEDIEVELTDGPRSVCLERLSIGFPVPLEP